MQNRSETVSSAEAHARALSEHECAGPKTVFTNADGRRCIQEQCVFCFRRVGGAVKPCADVFGQAIAGQEEYAGKVTTGELVERWRRLLAYRDMSEGLRPSVRFKPIGETDPLQAVKVRIWNATKAERYQREDWKLLRKRVIERCAGVCELCGVGGGLDVHHLSYRNFGKENLEDLAALCRPCHYTKMHPDKL